jgi:hypothetical protein
MPDPSVTASMDWETPLVGVINTLVAISKLDRSANQVQTSRDNRVVHGSHFQVIFGSFSIPFSDHFQCLAEK